MQLDTFEVIGGSPPRGRVPPPRATKETPLDIKAGVVTPHRAVIPTNPGTPHNPAQGRPGFGVWAGLGGRGAGVAGQRRQR